MARKISIFSTKTNSLTNVESDATTWGELKSQISHLFAEEMVATVVETKNQLIVSDAILPTGDFKLVLTPSKTKSGQEIIDVASAIATLKEKFDTAFQELLDEIENGDHSKYLDTKSSSSETDQLKKEAESIKRSLGL